MFRTSRRALIGLGTLLLAGVVASVTTVAMAEESPPTTMELLDKCGNGADFCEFHIEGPARTYFAALEEARGDAPNCSSTESAMKIMWEKTTTSTNSIGVSLKVSWGPTKVFESSFKVAYQHEWIHSTTDRETNTVNVPPKHVGHIYVAREMEEVSGKYELHFGSRFHGHYYWYVPMTVTSPKANSAKNVVGQSFPMTDEQRSKCPA
jgi:hypothetical protein